ncbi:MAG: DMT family transporter [Desulfovibrio sp.]|nr:DMT family transporter [Desulfovibrio sp.]
MERGKASQKSAYLRMHAATLLFGVSGLLGRLCTSSAMTLVLGRALFAIAALGLFGLLGSTWKREGGALSRRDWLWLIPSGVLLALHFVTFFQGIQLGGIAVGTLGFACFPALTALAEALVFRERPGSREIQAIVMVAFGLTLLVPMDAIFSTQGAGLFFGVLSAAIYAGVAVLNRCLASDVSGTKASFWQNGIIVLVLAPFASQGLWQAPPMDWLYFAGLGIFCTAVAYSLYVESLRSLAARQAALIIALEPVYTILLGWLVLGEVPNVLTCLGGVCILGAVYRLQNR